MDPGLADRVDRFCTAMGLSESALVKSALGQYLDETKDATLLLRRLDRLGRAEARTQRDLEVLSQAFGVFVRLWLAHTPTVAAEAKPGARVNAENRYGRFTQHVADQFSAGRRFLDDLPREVVAEEAELDMIVDNSSGSPDKSDKG
jgi:predicted transcriptional regulator